MMFSKNIIAYLFAIFLVAPSKLIMCDANGYENRKET
jgi:hypothetical protein